MTPLYRYEKVRRAEAVSNNCAQFCVDMITAVPSRAPEMRAWLITECQRMARAWGIVRDHCRAQLRQPVAGMNDEALHRMAVTARLFRERWQRIEWEAIKCT